MVGIKTYGRLLNSQDAITVCDDLSTQTSSLPAKATVEQISRLKEIFAPIVSTTGAADGSKAIWFFSAYQGVNSNTSLAEDFETDVYAPIQDFFRRTKRTSDSNRNGKIVLPVNIEDALKLYDTSPDWTVSSKVFELNTTSRLSVFEKLSVSF